MAVIAVRPGRTRADIERIRQPRLPAAVWTVTAADRGRYFEWQNVTPGLKTVAGHRVETHLSQGTSVTLSFGWSGFLAARGQRKSAGRV